MTIFEAYTGGLHNFFSIWFSCLFQVTPFFIAYITGLTMMEIGYKKWREGMPGILTGGISCLIGFMTGYILLGATALSISSIFFRYLYVLNQLGGVILLVTGLYFMGLFRLPQHTGKIFRRHIGLLVGLSFAFAYQPCVTPTLTSIYNMTKNPESVSRGSLLISFYSLGISTAFILVGLLISNLLSIEKLKNLRGIIQRISGGLIIIMSIMILANWMTIYKSYLVGWVHEH
jgi:cytochrome c-type biogenesis protein